MTSEEGTIPYPDDAAVVDRVLIGAMEVLLVVCFLLACYMVDTDYYERRGVIRGVHVGSAATCAKVRAALWHYQEVESEDRYEIRRVCPPPPDPKNVTP